jgi:hypothetical protein
MSIDLKINNMFSAGSIFNFGSWTFMEDDSGSSKVTS